jgi:hypothetical protein
MVANQNGRETNWKETKLAARKRGAKGEVLSSWRESGEGGPCFAVGLRSRSGKSQVSIGVILGPLFSGKRLPPKLARVVKWALDQRCCNERTNEQLSALS